MPVKSRPFFSRFAGVLFVLSASSEPARLGGPDRRTWPRNIPKSRASTRWPSPGRGRSPSKSTSRTERCGTVERRRRGIDEVRSRRRPGAPVRQGVSRRRGRFDSRFLKDEQGRYTRFRVVNEKPRWTRRGSKKRISTTPRPIPPRPATARAISKGITGKPSIRSPCGTASGSSPRSSARSIGPSPIPSFFSGRPTGSRLTARLSAT